MNTSYEFEEQSEIDLDPKRIVYVKTVDVSDLPDDVQEQVDGHEQVYSVHTEDGEQLALVANRKLAFVLARQNDFSPVAVH